MAGGGLKTYAEAIGKSRDYLLGTKLGRMIYEKRPESADALIGELSHCVAMLYMGEKPGLVLKVAHSRLQRYAPGDDELALLLNDGFEQMCGLAEKKE